MVGRFFKPSARPGRFAKQSYGPRKSW